LYGFTGGFHIDIQFPGLTRVAVHNIATGQPSAVTVFILIKGTTLYFSF